MSVESRILWTEPEQRALIGDCREGLRSLPEKSVQSCICSPPFLNLRSYGTEPAIWSGNPNCLHEWSAEGVSHQRLRNGQGSDTAKVQMPVTLHPSTGAFCVHCGAWRGELGNEPTPALFIQHLCGVFAEVHRVLRDDGVLLVNLGDSYCNAGSRNNGTGLDGNRRGGMSNTGGTWKGAKKSHGDMRCSLREHGIKHKDLCMVPQRFAIAMQDAGWYVRSFMPWVKRAAMPDSVTDRPGSAVEYFMLFAKSERYFWDHIAVMRKGSGKGGGASFGKQLNSTDGTGAAARRLESAAERSEIEGMRNFRNSDLFFSSMENPPYGLISDEFGTPLLLDVNPQAFHGGHFAAFAENLVEPLLLASTSAAGCCTECGTPLKRISEKQIKVHDKWYGDKYEDAGRNNRGSAGASYREVVGIRTAGWEPGCKCNANAVPCTVLDCFGGTATTLSVAKQHGRRGIACELNPEYIPLMQSRLNGVSARKEKENPAQGSLGLECA